MSYERGFLGTRLAWLARRTFSALSLSTSSTRSSFSSCTRASSLSFAESSSSSVILLFSKSSILSFCSVQKTFFRFPFVLLIPRDKKKETAFFREFLEKKKAEENYFLMIFFELSLGARDFR